jgi:hypothetical protein
MIAINSSRRKPAHSVAKRGIVEMLQACGGGATLGSAVQARASRRAFSGVEISRGRTGHIDEVRVGRWRVLTASAGRRIADVRELGCRRVAVKIERFVDSGPMPSSEIWQLYDLEGRLEASMQTTLDGKFAMLTNYRTRQVCRMQTDDRGALQPVETWRI